MKRDIGRLKAEHFDILVIGGGINGCAIARDAALRGAKTALIEKCDFASGASGKTTKLIHGGIRYLEQLNFKLVYEALHERATLLKTAPHLVRPLEFILPVYKNDPRSLLKIKAGVCIYDWLAGKDNVRCHRTLKKDEAMRVEPDIVSGDLKGAVIYCDAQMDDIRLCLDNAISAYDAGCVVANRLEAVKFIKDKERITGVEAQDKLTSEKFLIHVKIVVNATGAWSNQIVKVDESNALAITRPTKGIHIVYKKLPHTRAIIFSGGKDKRLIFVIPWRSHTLIGTTDTDYGGSCDEVYATVDEIDYLLEEVRRIFPNQNIDRGGIITTFAGLRPLINTQGRPAWHVSREHLVKESNSGLISVVGGKYTTYRHLAQQVVDVAISRLGSRNFKECTTATIGPSSAEDGEENVNLRQRIDYAVKEEMTCTLTDLLARRLQLATSPSLGLDKADECSQVMAELLGWSSSQADSQMHLYKEEIRKNMVF